MAAAPEAGLDGRERVGDLEQRWARLGRGLVPCPVEDVLDREAQVGVPVVGGGEVGAAAADHPGDGVDDGRPARGRSRAGRPPETVVRSGRRGDGQLVGASGWRRYSASSAVFSDVRVVAATRSASSLQRRMAAMVYGAAGMAPRAWFPEAVAGDPGRAAPPRAGQPGCLPPVVRRPRDRPAGALPGSRRCGPTRSSDSSPRGSSGRMPWPWPSTSARPTDLVGTCAFSQLDGDNGSALYHITIGEKDAWGQGYGTEATRLMLDHAFGTLGLHRVALYVFEFNERAIRAYRRCGFVVEGRSRESIFRDGRWWDEMAMSVLESDWRRAGRRREDRRRRSGPRPPARPRRAETAEDVEMGRPRRRVSRPSTERAAADDAEVRPMQLERGVQRPRRRHGPRCAT